MNHHGTQSNLTCPPMLTTRQQCLVLCDMFFRRMCRRICYVHFCCQPTPQMQNYSSLWLITYQENSALVPLCLHVHGWRSCHNWIAFWFHCLDQTGCFWMWVYTLFHPREVVASQKMSPWLNNVLLDVIKIVNHSKVHALNQGLSAQLGEEMDTVHVFSSTQKWDGCLKVDHSQSVCITRVTSEISFRKTVTTGSTLQWHRMGHKSCLFMWHI